MIGTIDLRVWSFKISDLDSGFRRRDEFEALSLLVIPAPIFIGINSSRNPVVSY
jgi:hypothetical protein